MDYIHAWYYQIAILINKNMDKRQTMIWCKISIEKWKSIYTGNITINKIFEKK